MTRDQAWGIVQKYVKSENLRKHMLAVEAALVKYYEYFARNSKSQITNSKEEWQLVGLLHDFDWEIHPTLGEHPQKGEAILEKEGLPKQLRHAILSHAEHLHIPRETLLEKTLCAVDELTGLIVAVALIKGRKLENVRIESVKKKWKQKSFAKGVSREDIEHGAADLGVPLEKHIEIVLKGMKEIAGELGL